jgi:carbonic anhydrase/acetyltransferase-like protein (isoleucine patch superfamily)
MMSPDTSSLKRIALDVKLGRDVKIYDFVNLYGCEIGDNSKIGTFVEIQKNSKIGRNCKISSHTFICEGVTVETRQVACRPKRIGFASPQRLKKGHRSVPVQRCCAASRSVRTRLLEPAVLSSLMCLQMLLSQEILQNVYEK